MKQKTLIILDIALAIYILLAITSFNTPNNRNATCTEVNIIVSNTENNGFLNSQEIKNILETKHLYPISKQMKDINVRDIETTLKKNPFVDNVQCFKTQDNKVNINIEQPIPVVRIKSDNGADYYINQKGKIMSKTSYVSNIIIATGNIEKRYAQAIIYNVANVINNNPLWKNLIVQINVTPNRGIELVPRVGNHIIYIGKIRTQHKEENAKEDINKQVEKKLTRLEKFYKYGLNKIGWNKYDYINVEFENQIICRKHQNQV